MSDKVTVRPKPIDTGDVRHTAIGTNVENPEIDLIHPVTGEHMVAKYEAFCVEYVNHFDPKQAMAAAGYPVTEKRHDTMMQAFRTVMYRKDVQARIRGLIRERADHIGIGPDWVVMKWLELLDRCMQKEAVLDHEGNPTGEWKFAAREANAVLENLAKYFGMFQRSERDGAAVILNLNYGGEAPQVLEGSGKRIN